MISLLLNEKDTQSKRGYWSLESRTHRPPHIGEPGGIIKVLYVDDEPALLNIAKEFLEMEGDVSVTTSTSVGNAFEDAASGRYDIILSDYSMPEQDGIAFLKMLRKRGADTPFVLFTGRGRKEVAVEALNNGADFYVQKGGDPLVQYEELHNVISQLAQRSRAERTLYEREEALSLITDNMRDIVAKVDKDGRVTYVSPSLIPAAGYAPEEVIGRSVFEFIHPDDVAKVKNDADEAIARREGVTLEYRLLRKDGTYTWVETKGKYLFDGEGAVQTSVFSIRSIDKRKRFEEELLLGSMRCRSIVDASNVIILNLDMEGRVTWMNEFAQQFFGFTEEEIVGRPTIGTIIPETEEGTGKDLGRMMNEAVLKTDSYTANVNQNIKKNGERVWVAWTNRRMDMGDGKTEVLCTGVDITERHQSLEVLERSNALLQSILDSIITAVVVITRQWTIEAYNHQFLDIWQLFDTYQGMPFSDLIEAIAPLLEDPEALRSLYRKAMESKNDWGLSVIELKDGRRYGVDVRPYRVGGVDAGMVWSFFDHTGLMEAKQALAERESKFRAVFDSKAIGIGLIDEHGSIVEGNEALTRLMGYGMEEMRGKRFSEFAVPEEGEAEGRMYLELIDGGRDTYTMERRFLTKGGKVIWARVTGSAVRDDHGKLMFGVGFIQDITEQKEMMERLRRSEERYRELARNLPSSMVMLYDREFRYTLVDGRGLGAMGLARDGMEGKTVDEVFQTGPFSREGGRYDNTLRGETSVRTVEYLGRTFRTFDMPLVGEDGEVYGGIVMNQDITDLKRTEDALRGMNRSLRILTVGDRARVQSADECEMYRNLCQELVGASGHGMACIALYEEGEWPRIAATFGGGVQGRDLAMLDREGVAGEAMRTGRPSVAGDTSDLSDKGAAGQEEGSYAAVPLYHHDRAIGVLALFDPEKGSFPEDEVNLLARLAGDISAGIATFRDRADKQRSRRVLGRQREQMKRLSGSSRQITSTLDEETVKRALTRSARELLDCEVCMVGNLVDGRIVFKEMDRRGAIVPVDMSFGPGEGLPGRVMEAMLPCASGRGEGGVYRNMAAVPLIGRDGRLAGALWAMDKRRGSFDPWDLSLMESLGATAMIARYNADVVRRLRCREEELEQANRKLDLIGRITRHDLLNHLSTLAGYLELARMRSADGRASSYLERASESAGNISKHLTFARDYAEVGKSAPEWVPLREAVRRGASTINLGDATLEILGDSVELYVDRMVEKVFHNLLDNSLRHGGVTGMRITVEEGASGLSIIYADDGKGIEDSRKEEIFDLESGHHGLYLAKKVLALTGIRIRELGKEGEGARFEILVPRGSYRRSENRNGSDLLER